MTLLFSDKLHDDLARLVNQETDADIKFLIGKEEVVRYGHSLILKSRCSYFEAALQPAWRETSDGVFRKPNIEPDVFDIILDYLYSARITVSLDILSRVVDAAAELGLQELVSGCEELACQHVTYNHFCNMFALADRHNLKKLTSTSIKFIEAHGSAILQENLFLDMDVDTLIKMLSLDSLNVDELLVWKAIVRYAYYHNALDYLDCPILKFPIWPGHLTIHAVEDESHGAVMSVGYNNEDVDTGESDVSFSGEELPMSANEATKAATPTNPTRDTVVTMPMSQFKRLQCTIRPLLAAIRFASLEFNDFVRLIEGTGFVSLDQCHQVYRHHKLPASLCAGSELQRPRSFISTKLEPIYWRQLMLRVKDAAYPKETPDHLKAPLRLRKLYFAPKDGFDASKFHELCDNRGSTLTIALTSTGDIVGAFNPQPWSSTISFAGSSQAFIFHVDVMEGKVSGSFPYIVHHAHAAFNHPNSGPAFGKGCDLRFTSDGKGCTCIQVSYPPTWKSPSLGDKFDVVHCEIFQVIAD